VAVAPEETSIESAKLIPNAAAFTVMLSLTVPESPVHEMEKTIFSDDITMLSYPERALLPDQFPDAVQAVVLLEIHDKVIKVFGLADTGPSSPLILMSVCGVPAPSTHLPAAEHDLPAAHAPQSKIPPQASFHAPHSYPAEEQVLAVQSESEGTETHWPSEHFCPEAHFEPSSAHPNPSVLQTLHPETSPGVHEATHWPEALQVCPEAQAPQKSQPPHWSATVPHCLPCAEQLLQVPGQ